MNFFPRKLALAVSLDSGEISPTKWPSKVVGWIFITGSKEGFPKRPRGIFSVFNFAPYLWWTKLGSSDHIFCFSYKYIRPYPPGVTHSSRTLHGLWNLPPIDYILANGKSLNFNYWLRDMSHFAFPSYGSWKFILKCFKYRWIYIFK